MNNEKSSIYQEYSQIQEKNQWMVVYQVISLLAETVKIYLLIRLRYITS